MVLISLYCVWIRSWRVRRRDCLLSKYPFHERNSNPRSKALHCGNCAYRRINNDVPEWTYRSYDHIITVIALKLMFLLRSWHDFKRLRCLVMSVHELTTVPASNEVRACSCLACSQFPVSVPNTQQVLHLPTCSHCRLVIRHLLVLHCVSVSESPTYRPS